MSALLYQFYSYIRADFERDSDPTGVANLSLISVWAQGSGIAPEGALSGDRGHAFLARHSLPPPTGFGRESSLSEDVCQKK